MKIRFGVGLGAETAPDELPAIVDHLEATGVDSLWFSELVYSKAVDPFIGMAHALARTDNLKVGTSVAVLPGRHPVLVAKQLASLAALAPKRVLPVFGLRSAIPAEREIFVVPDGRACRRVRRIAAIAEIRSGTRRCLVRRRLLLREFGRSSRPVRSSRWTSGSAARPRRVSGGSVGWVTGGWAASSLLPKLATVANRSNGRRSGPGAQSRRTISASISPSATVPARRGRRCDPPPQTRPGPDGIHRRQLVTPSSAARRLPRSGAEQVRHPAGRADRHRGFHRPICG